jgi:hypothetical protein
VYGAQGTFDVWDAKHVLVSGTMVFSEAREIPHVSVDSILCSLNISKQDMS